ncbi:MAG: citramalate synthase [Planctomycetota bacterium]
MKKIVIYDTTLRDGCQAEGISLSLEDKLALTQRLDEFGIDYIEGGYPQSNPKDASYFREAAHLALSHAQVVAFGSTRRAKYAADKDPGLRALLGAGTGTVAVVAKSWDLHVRDVLRVGPKDNLAMISDSVRHLKKEGRTVFLDAEHFFDGYAHNPKYAMKTLRAALDSGADALVLCDTNGGTTVSAVAAAVSRVRRETRLYRPVIGIHTHNDSGLAVANTLAAVERGARHVQGTLNGVGERCGNADLCSLVPNLVLKLGCDCSARANLKQLTELSRYFYSLANLAVPHGQPYVGLSAFSHKGGMHIDAMKKNERTYEHVPPDTIGNTRRILLSELSGSASILQKMEKSDIARDPETMRRVLAKVQKLENEGYLFEAAEASFEILVKKMLRKHRSFWKLHGYRIIVEQRGEMPVTEATLKLGVGSRTFHTVAEGDGPVNALDGALRLALEGVYPQLKDMRLLDYKVRVVNPRAATAARVRVTIESRDETDVWGTVGVSENIIEASWLALVDSFEYKLLKG